MAAILGGGISGLSAAYYALDNPKIGSVVLFEASDRLGGWIRSNRSSTGAIFEQGPRTVRLAGLAGKNSLSLIESLNLSSKIVPIKKDHPGASNRMIYVNKKLHRLPSSGLDLFKIKTPFKRPLFTAIFNDLKAPFVQLEDDSLYNFTKRRLGQDIADNLISAITCGIYAGNAKELSVKTIMKSAFEAEQSGGTISKESNDFTKSSLMQQALHEKWVMWSLQGGLEHLPISLSNYLESKGISIQLNKKCEKLLFEKDFVILTVNGEVKKYKNVISSLPAKILANLLQEQHPQLAQELIAIPYVTVGVVNIEFSGNVLNQEAFGFLVPPKEEIPILGIIFDSCIIPQTNSTVLTVMMGGAWFNKYFGESPSKETLLSVATTAVRDILKIKLDPIAYKVSILKDCIPQPIVGHSQRVSRINDYISTRRIPLALCGSSYEGVGINDVILSAKQAVSNFG
ncbi:protoporphyrinogen oxidase isoform X2 [Prorops nasuta]|uniref:protoporphyrinogen oxidase isoform X2 n=1 Tax=Prorops nasuta TaxID=863751 RepID=UPI0034CF3824